jgi:DNA-binding transcriptional ArsR family regulator
MFSKSFIRLLDLNKQDLNILDTLHRLKIPSLVSVIQRNCSIPRSSLVYRLGKLKKKGLIDVSYIGQREFFRPKTQSDIVSNVLVKNNDEANDACKIYSGVQEIISLWYKMISLPKHTRFTVIQPYRSFRLALQKTPPEIAIDISERIKKNAFIIDAIEQQKAVDVIATVYGKSKITSRLAHAFVDRLEDMVKVPDDFLDEKSELYMFQNTVVFIDWNTEIAIEIKNQHIFHLVLSMFEKTKAYGNRYELGKSVKKLIAKK